jgi:dihydropteroate synthase
MAGPRWQCGRFDLSLDRTVVMGVLNVTPDSFSDGGQHDAADAAITHACKLIEQGADIIDIGGESTRPGAEPVSVQQELARVLPVIEALQRSNIPISVDTCKPEVMRAALDAGADIINDISGFKNPLVRQVVASHPTCGLCVMHMQGEPRTMQQAPYYDDVTVEVSRDLHRMAVALEALGIARERITLDPGFGFGKSVAHNFELMRKLRILVDLGYPVLVGVSRKSMIGAVTGRPVEQRLAGSLAGALAALARGAHIIRVHDVEQTVDAVRVWEAVEKGLLESV